MAAEGANNELEEQLRDVGARLQAAPDDADGLLKLLAEVEDYLTRVEQSPPGSTSDAVRPAMAALVREDLLSHSNADVKLGVASCISEITRITAPEAPYDDNVMKDVFSIIVGAFQNLDDIESPSFARIFSILDTVVKVRSCVVMLDLELDDLIRDMFNHFFKTVSSNHPEYVISSMVTTMRLVIDESEEVQTALVSCLLQNVRNEEREKSPASFELAEKVISSCDAEKLKPILLELLQVEGTSLDDYSKVVMLVCEGAEVVKEDNNVDPSGKDTVDDGKLSERTISDELPQESSKVEQDGTPTTAISSGATPVDNNEASEAPPSPKDKPCNTEDTEDVGQLKSGNSEGAESLDAKPKKSSEVDSDKGLKLKSSKSEATPHSDVDIDKDTSGELSADKKAVNGVADKTSKLADVVKPKRGRPPGPKSSEKKAGRNNKPSGLDLKKAEATNSAGKLTKRSAKDDVKSSTRKAGEEESSKKQQNHKDETLSEDDTAKDPTLKEMATPKSLAKGSGRTKGQGRENSGMKRKREQETEETPRSRKNKGLDGSLVGSRIKVWWPDDEMFYKGIVDSFDTNSKRHKVAYDDGDVEVLLLRDEKWDFIGEEKDRTPDVATETRRGRKGRGNSVQSVKEEKTETPKSDGGSLPKKRGRPKGWRPNNGGMPSTTPSKSKGKIASKDAKATPKTGSDLKREGEKGSKDKATQSADKTKVDVPKDSSKGKDESKSGDGSVKGRPGRKPKAAVTPAAEDESVKEKLKDKEAEASEMQEASGKGKDSKDENKSGDGSVKGRPGRKPKVAATPTADSGSVKEKRKEKEAEASELEQEASGKASAGNKRRRKA